MTLLHLISIQILQQHNNLQIVVNISKIELPENNISNCLFAGGGGGAGGRGCGACKVYPGYRQPAAGRLLPAVHGALGQGEERGDSANCIRIV